MHEHTTFHIDRAASRNINRHSKQQPRYDHFGIPERDRRELMQKTLASHGISTVAPISKRKQETRDPRALKLKMRPSLDVLAHASTNETVMLRSTTLTPCPAYSLLLQTPTPTHSYKARPILLPHLGTIGVAAEPMPS